MDRQMDGQTRNQIERVSHKQISRQIQARMVTQMDGQTRNQIERRRHKQIYRQIQARRDPRTDKQTEVHKDKWLNQCNRAYWTLMQENNSFKLLQRSN